MIEPVEGVDFCRINQVRYELHVEVNYFIMADEDCGDFAVDPSKINLGEPIVVGKEILRTVERRIDDPTKAFDRDAWMAEHNPRPGDRERPDCEATLAAFAEGVE